ncbi:hypothetical protein RB195_013412 [Necator americanus]|uniref:Uncharacterized protein n=1 Tax=Necator americanus TaxID=51031 RepID=A0ABR1DVJ1_NECAM
MRYTLILIVLAVTSTECSDELPDCSEEAKHPLEKGIKEKLSEEIKSKVQKKEVGKELEYRCELEYLGWLVLEDPNKDMTWLYPESMKNYPEDFSILISTQNKTNINVTEATKAVLKEWDLHLTRLKNSEFFGCSYKKEYETHKYICIFY